MRRFATTILLCLTACGGGGGATPLGGAAVTPELVACRSRVTHAIGFSEIALRTAQNLGTARVSDRSGIERRARLHPDDTTLVFARERANDDPRSRELFTSTIDGSAQERRLTVNTELDDEPCWSPTGDAILYATENAGPRSLWLCDPDGRNQRQLLAPPPGATDGQPDWSRTTDRIVFSRRDAAGLHTLWLVQGDGTGAVPFTDGGTAMAGELGDHHPTFSPSGENVAFVRRRPAGSALCFAPVATGVVTERYATTGQIGLPRYAPALDRIYFGLDEPDRGRAGLRLAFIPILGGEPVLVWPDERYVLEGIELLANLPDHEPGLAPVTLDADAAELEIAWGSYAFGARSQLTAADGNAYVLGTRTTGNYETAGLTATFALPVPDALETLELRIRVVAGVSRIGGGTALRISLFNPVESRFDTAVELEPGTTGLHTLEFRTASLRHVTRERKIRFNVIGEVERGDRAELSVDFIEAILTARAIN